MDKKGDIKKELNGLHYHEILRRAGQAHINMFGKTRSALETELINFQLSGGVLSEVAVAAAPAKKTVAVKPASRLRAQFPKAATTTTDKPVVKAETPRMLRQARRFNTVTHGINQHINDDLDVQLFSLGIVTKANFSPEFKRQLVTMAQSVM